MDRVEWQRRKVKVARGGCDSERARRESVDLKMAVNCCAFSRGRTQPRTENVSPMNSLETSSIEFNQSQRPAVFNASDTLDDSA